ncbi:dihydroxyacetone kinase phosphoryl donor subunit DhaM [Agreia sp.]|uniref:dihydroxyacetone kinase phosphoryl donor subunit DhaM n=1 Tax=Agreia sp. TaxID=1872416 RepID=UPI0035BC18A4
MKGVAGKVGLVFVSHSAKIADGLVELAQQMAQNTAMQGAGGTDDGGIGTSFDRVGAAIDSVDSGAGVVVLCDLGSAILTAETAKDLLDDEVRDRVVIVDAPLVEGAVAAAVEAESGADLDSVASAARSAIGAFAGDQPHPVVDDAGAGYTRSVTIVNPDGLHARPAAEFVKLALSLGVPVTVNGADARSLLGIMSLGLVKGGSVELSTPSPAGRAAVDSLAELVESGFGEA